MRGAALAAVLALSAAGCLDIHATTSPVPVCAAAYPDGLAKSCARDDAVAAAAPPAAGLGWACIGALADVAGGDWDVRYELWQANDGRWRVGLFGHGAGEADAVVSTVTLSDGAERQLASRIVATRADGWVDLGPAAGVASWSVWTHAFAADGADVAVHATAWNGTTWFVYAAADGAWAMDGMRLERSAQYVAADQAFEVRGTGVVVDESTLLHRTAAVSRLAPTPGVGLPCNTPA